MALHTILGAGGIISNLLAKELVQNKEKVRLVSRNPKPMGDAELVSADASNADELIDAISGTSILYVCIGLKYDFSVWRVQWPRIMDNLIEACKRTGARMIFFDNVYMYGKTSGAMTENTPYNPSSRKGDLRARIATQLMSEVRKGNITASIARAADFYGPGGDKTSMANILVFAPLAQSKNAQWLVDTSKLHSFTYTPDAAKALYILAKDDHSWNQVWHLPTAADPLTGAAFIELAAAALDAKPAITLLRPWMMWMAGIFNTDIRELREMLYQYDADYIFDSSKFDKAYGFQPLSYRQGITATALSYKK